jgi:predicted transcriptional regulator
VSTALASTQGALNPLKEVKADMILARYLAEESTTQIAKSLGVTRSALNYWLLENCEKEWRSAQVIRAMKRKEDAEDAIDQASDALTLARAREALRAAQWDLERVCRRIYGQDVPVNAGAGVQININLRRTNGDIVDVSPEDISVK